jgi:hypothetical protein
VQPNADFTEFYFTPDAILGSLTDPQIILMFELSLANFNGGSLFTAGITVAGGASGESRVTAWSVHCRLERLLRDGLACPVHSAPATPPLFAADLGALGLLGWRRKHKTSVSLLGVA